ncbi:PREDICTED: cation/H(+) antiporter 15-like [Nelumbo nucifera]|uniref:Cation/H(+) antiporter 15-like n=1 Tax=Nelumbo nucifera TaxID=4432 RepID=A0A1U8A504_NELNU|nr:PREDICTED: cation/H(+) antiporter 15-like [Nelumbo nucifera]
MIMILLQKGGIMLGPTFLGRNQRLRNVVFPEREGVVLNTISEVSMMYMFFLIGVKMDSNLILKPSRRALKIGLSCLLLPFMLVSTAAVFLEEFLPIPNDASFLVFFSLTLSISAFPATAHAMDELNLLTSELGKLAMSCAMVNDMIGWVFITIVTVIGQRNLTDSFGVILSLSAFIICATHVLRPCIMWIIKRIRIGGEVEQSYIVIILVGAVATGFVSDLIGLSPVTGALVLGIVIPEGSSLGITLVQKAETIITEILLPFFFLRCGLYTDLFKIRNHTTFACLQFIMLLAHVGKVVGTMISCKLNTQHSFSLALIMNIKGLINITVFIQWRTRKLIDDECLTILVLSSLLVTALIMPVLTTLYKPPRYFGIDTAGAIQTARTNHELRIVACITDEKSVNAIISVIEAFHPTQNSPIYAYVLHLVELVGRSLPVVADPSTIDNWDTCKPTTSDQIVRAFNKYSVCSNGTVNVQPLTVITPCKTVHEDICWLAHANRATLILLPFYKNDLRMSGAAISSLTHNVLAGAHCSVGLLVDHSSYRSYSRPAGRGHYSYNVLLIFLGGADDRETLALCSRMSTHPGLSVTILRFLLSNDKENERDRHLDDPLLYEFKLKNINNEVSQIREEVVDDMEQAFSLIRSLKSDYQLMMVGRRHGTCKAHNGAMADWTENTELGVLGDTLATTEFSDSEFSVLVVQAAL